MESANFHFNEVSFILNLKVTLYLVTCLVYSEK